jgi:hypothetical protein
MAQVPLRFQEPGMTTNTARLSVAAIAALSADELLNAEYAMHVRFSELDAIERRTKGSRYNLMRGSVELVDAWDQWGRLTKAAQARQLTPLKMAPTAPFGGRK